MFVSVPDNSNANVQYIISQLFNSNIVVEYQDSNNLIDALAVELSALVGEGNYSIKLDNETQTLHMEFTLAAWQNKMNDVESLLNRVLLMNLDVDILVDGVPTQYTQLEYLECSGTQWSRLGSYSAYMGARAVVAYTGLGNQFVIGTASVNFTFFRAVGPSTSSGTHGFAGQVANVNCTMWPRIDVVKNKVIVCQNWKMDGKGIFKDPYSDYADIRNNAFTAQLENAGGTMWLFSHNGGYYNFVGKLHELEISTGEDVYMQLVPVLDVDGVPCMFDKVSRQCFYNQGKGTFGYRIKTVESESSTFSLRDPYYTAPSGVWAKLIAENTLDIIADTDMQDGEGHGYAWFANTGEAYEHFGIKEEPLNNI